MCDGWLPFCVFDVYFTCVFGVGVSYACEVYLSLFRVAFDCGAFVVLVGYFDCVYLGWFILLLWVSI